jgi:site-specific recombinase XerD
MEREMRIRNYSERTIGSYLSSITKLTEYYKLPPGKITTSQLKSYLYFIIHDEKASVSRINQIISAWKILQQDIFQRKWGDISIKRPRRERKLPDILSIKEAQMLVNTPKNYKHRALLSLAYATGLRRNEILYARLQDIDRERKMIRVKGKGNKEREIPLTEDMLILLTDYYRRYRPSLYLFEGNIPGKSYSASSMVKIINNSACKSGIKKNIYPHILRHSFATHMLEKGVNLKRLQLLMGHNSMKTTSVYLHLADVDKVELPNLLIP